MLQQIYMNKISQSQRIDNEQKNLNIALMNTKTNNNQKVTDNDRDDGMRHVYQVRVDNVVFEELPDFNTGFAFWVSEDHFISRKYSGHEKSLVEVTMDDDCNILRERLLMKGLIK